MLLAMLPIEAVVLPNGMCCLVGVTLLNGTALDASCVETLFTDFVYVCIGYQMHFV